MSQPFDAYAETKLIEKQCSEILRSNDKDANSALRHELGDILRNPQEFRAIQKLIRADNAVHDLPPGLGKIDFIKVNGKEILEFSSDKTPLG